MWEKRQKAILTIHMVHHSCTIWLWWIRDFFKPLNIKPHTVTIQTEQGWQNRKSACRIPEIVWLWGRWGCCQAKRHCSSQDFPSPSVTFSFESFTKRPNILNSSIFKYRKSCILVMEFKTTFLNIFQSPDKVQLLLSLIRCLMLTHLPNSWPFPFLCPPLDSESLSDRPFRG